MNGITEVLANTTQTQLAAELARRTGQKVTQQSISAWKRNGYVPGKWARLVAEISGVPIERLLPQ